MPEINSEPQRGLSHFHFWGFPHIKKNQRISKQECANSVCLSFKILILLIYTKITYVSTIYKSLQDTLKHESLLGMKWNHSSSPFWSVFFSVFFLSMVVLPQPSLRLCGEHPSVLSQWSSLSICSTLFRDCWRSLWSQGLVIPLPVPTVLLSASFPVLIHLP